MPAPSHGSHANERRAPTKSTPSRQWQRPHPLGIHGSSSSLSLSSLSQNSIASSSFNGSISSWDRKIPFSFRQMFGSRGREEEEEESGCFGRGEVGTNLKRCNWITKNSDEVYVSFHDKCWGVPVYSDSEQFELLALCGMLIDCNWTEILKRRELYRDAFAKFDYNVVAKMEENDIMLISSKKELFLGEGRVRCIIDNAKCIQKVVKEFGSFSGYIWGHVNHKAMVSKFKDQKSVPLRSPKAEALSKDLLRRGFRLAGPVIVYSFMQATGIAVDHILRCFRFGECARLARAFPSKFA
ncbi:hypothetical protein KSP40_PGU013764 [Platanthera guangdongensis]|uniref:DNA-3-methyladenine glycosylase I n=1 Tax=Platanthera guangdongensis TaxID=2320717 RepID=A0ABR2LTF9_9ASPA